MAKFKYDIAPTALCTFLNFRNCTPILQKLQVPKLNMTSAD